MTINDSDRYTCLVLLDSRFLPLTPSQIERQLMTELDWDLNSFSAVKLIFSDDSVSVGVDIPTDLNFTVELENKIDTALDSKLYEMGYA